MVDKEGARLLLEYYEQAVVVSNVNRWTQLPPQFDLAGIPKDSVEICLHEGVAVVQTNVIVLARLLQLLLNQR